MPQIPYDILDRIRALEQQITDLYGRVGQRPAMNQIQAGDVTVGQGGTFKVNNNSGAPEFYVGGISPANPDGTGQRGLLAYRQDGSLAMMIANQTSNVGDPQGVSIKDARGNTIFAEDVIAGGLAVGVFGADAWYGYTEVPQWTTSSGAWTTCMSLPWRKQHPRVQAYFLARCSDGTTAGDIRLLDGSGAVIGQTSLTAGEYSTGSVTGPITGTHLGTQTLVWQARVTSGSGTVGVRGLSTFGVGS